MMEVIDKLSSAAQKLVPPAEGASESHVRKWRIWIAAATFLNAMGLSIHIALACGFAAPFYGGFAQASEVGGRLTAMQTQMVQVKHELQAKRIQELSSLILDTKEKHCVSSGTAKRLYFNTLNNLRTEYYELMRREFPDPPCSDFQ